MLNLQINFMAIINGCMKIFFYTFMSCRYHFTLLSSITHLCMDPAVNFVMFVNFIQKLSIQCNRVVPFLEQITLASCLMNIKKSYWFELVFNTALWYLQCKQKGNFFICNQIGHWNIYNTFEMELNWIGKCVLIPSPLFKQLKQSLAWQIAFSKKNEIILSRAFHTVPNRKWLLF